MSLSLLKEKLYFKDKNDYVGLGWSHNFNKEGIWSEGKSSNLLFNLKTKEKFFSKWTFFLSKRKKSRNEYNNSCQREI